MNDTSAFSKRLREQLNSAAARRIERHDHLDREMSALMQREVDFDSTASRLMAEVIRPRMEKLAECFENASTLDSPRCYRVHFDHCDRYPATVDVQITTLPDEAVQSVLIIIDIHILPVFIKFDEHNQLALPLSLETKVSEARAATWLEDRLVQFVADYLSIEHEEQYHQRNCAIDPVCGMKVLKKDALKGEHYGQTFYFCAAVCRDRFADDPDSFLKDPERSS